MNLLCTKINKNLNEDMQNNSIYLVLCRNVENILVLSMQIDKVYYIVSEN